MKIKTNKQGVVLVTVLMISIVLIIMTIGIISRNTSQRTAIQRQIDEIRAEQVAQGALWQFYADLADGNEPVWSGSVVIEQKTYSYEIVNTQQADPQYGTYTYTVNVDYN